ncbi:MAG: response regulator transcription factor [Christensenellales bacterium]|jgi:DNA-binding response OmpR family regulator
MHLLIVEDEKRLADVLAQILREQTYTVDAVYDGADGLVYALQESYDVIILDVMLPGCSGYEIARQLRAARRYTPILMLTAKDEVADKVTGLDCGADDYMTKPFAPEELLARVRALARRQGEMSLETLSFGDLALNLTNHELSRQGKSVRLSLKEFGVLRLLMANPRMVVAKDTLISRVWGVDSNAEDNNVEAYISFLRKKFFYLGSQVSIVSLRKVGYQLRLEAS